MERETGRSGTQGILAQGGWFVVTVDENTEFGKLVDWFVDLTDPPFQFLVIRRWHTQELDALLSQARNGMDDVAGSHGNMLHAGSAVKFQVLLDL